MASAAPAPVPDALGALIASLVPSGMPTTPRGRAAAHGRPAASGRPTAGQAPAQRSAAVLIAFHGEPDALKLVFVEKTAHLRVHSGQIAFPGGGVEAGDPSVEATALREAREEAGIVEGDVTVLGELPSADTLIVRSGYDVTPVVGWWAPRRPLTVGDTGEIAAIHDIGVGTLLDGANRLTWVHPNGISGPGFTVGELFIWGYTAKTLDRLFTLAGWGQPWDAGRRSPIPARFLG